MKMPLSTSLKFIAIATIALVPLLAGSQASAANDAKFSISPGSLSVTKGSSLTFTINVNPGSNSVSTWQAYLTYPTSLFSGGSMTGVGGSPFNFPVEHTVSGGVISAVYTTTDGASNYSGGLVTVTLNSIAAGAGSFSFGSPCSVSVTQACVSALYSTVNPDATYNVIGTGSTGASFAVNNPVVDTGGGSGGGSTGGTAGGGTTSTSKGGTTKTTTKTATTSKPATTTTTPSATTPTDPAAPTPTPTETTGEADTDAIVTLTLSDQDGKPIVGAKVTVDGVTGTTDKEGKVTLSNISSGPAKGTVSYKGKTQPISLNVADGSSEPTQTAKVTIKVNKSSAAAPIAITVGTLAVIAGAAFVLVGPGKGLSALTKKLPGRGPKPPVPPSASKGPTPPVTPTSPTAPTAPPPSNNAASNRPPQKPSSPGTSKHVDPLAPGTTFTPNSRI